MSLIEHYKLDENGNPVEMEDFLAWARWIEDHYDCRVIGKDFINDDKVSTIFLGLDHDVEEGGKPLLWETWIFSSDGYSEGVKRYSSKQEAIDGHAEVVSTVKTIGVKKYLEKEFS